MESKLLGTRRTGTHYTYPDFQKTVKPMELGPSMSRRGNFWDTAPQEKFFDHFKNEISLKNCAKLDEAKQEVKAYMSTTTTGLKISSIGLLASAYLLPDANYSECFIYMSKKTTNQRSVVILVYCTFQFKML